MKKYILLSLISASSLLPIVTRAENVDVDSMVTQMKSILDQYSAKIKALEVENALLRNEMMKAGIKIPLSAYTGAIASTGTTTPPPTQTSPGTNVENIKQVYGARYAGFITKIKTDWQNIKPAYKIPADAFIGGYEFVKQGNDNHVFVDIMYSPETLTGSYDAKLLYEYNTDTFQRKLVGFFEFNKSSGYYITKTGANPFAGVTRTFVTDPDAGNPIVPPTAGTGGAVNPPTTSTGTVTFADLDKLYKDKKYLSLITASNTYLLSNPPTFDLLRMRYRTYFIIGKYKEALAEIDKIESMGRLSTVACDAKVIVSTPYGNNATLYDKYSRLCTR